MHEVNRHPHSVSANTLHLEIGLHVLAQGLSEARGSCWSGTVAVEGLRIAAQKKFAEICARQLTRLEIGNFADMSAGQPPSFMCLDFGRQNDMKTCAARRVV